MNFPVNFATCTRWGPAGVEFASVVSAGYHMNIPIDYPTHNGSLPRISVCLSAMISPQCVGSVYIREHDTHMPHTSHVCLRVCLRAYFVHRPGWNTFAVQIISAGCLSSLIILFHWLWMNVLVVGYCEVFLIYYCFYKNKMFGFCVEMQIHN